MTIKIDLRAEANAEADRVRAIKAHPAASATARPLSGIPAAALRRPVTAGLRRAVAIFFMRARIVDGTGRLVEELIIPIEVGPRIEGRPQEVFDRWREPVRSVCLAEIAKRMTDLASQYRHGLERARARESKIEEMAQADRDALVQPGLFDGRVLKRPAVTGEGCQASPTSASSLLLAQQAETVFLLIVK